MENINALVKTIIVVTFIWSLSERLLSRSNIVKYTEFVYGLVIMTITVSSIINIKPYEFIPDISGAQKTTHYTQDYLKQVYEENLEKILSEKLNDKNIYVNLDDDYKITDITCKNKSTYDKIMGYLYE